MNIGETLFLTVDNEEYRAKIIDIDKKNHYIFIDLPVKEIDSKTAIFQDGIRLKVAFKDENENIYQFNTTIMHHLKQRIPAFILKLPEEEEMVKIQRRQFVRVKSAVDVAVASPTNNFTPFTTVTADISAGGVSIVLPHQPELISPHQECELTLVLHMNSESQHYIHVIGEVIRIHDQENKVNTASIKFIELNNKQQQMIVRFCFEKQREARQKELN